MGLMVIDGLSLSLFQVFYLLASPRNLTITSSKIASDRVANARPTFPRENFADADISLAHRARKAISLAHRAKNNTRRLFRTGLLLLRRTVPRRALDDVPCVHFHAAKKGGGKRRCSPFGDDTCSSLLLTS